MWKLISVFINFSGSEKNQQLSGVTKMLKPALMHQHRPYIDWFFSIDLMKINTFHCIIRQPN